MQNQHLPVYYLGHLIDVLKEHAFPIDTWLKQHNIDRKSLYQANTELNPEDIDALLTQILSQPLLAHIGLTLGRKLQIAHHGTFGLALLNCKTLREIVSFVCKYLLIRVPFIELTHIQQNYQLIVLAKDNYWHGKAHQFVIEAVTGAVFNIFSAIQEQVPKLHINRLFFDYPQPEYVDKYNVFAPIKIDFNHAYCGVAIDDSVLDVVIPNTDRLSFLQAQQACQTELDKLLHKTTVSGKVLQIMMRNTSTRPSLQQVSEDLNMSQRTLHRHLQQESTSFKQLLDTHQAALAKECLLVFSYSVNQTALHLGFVDVANFRRAFKRWYQCTPSQFIQQKGIKS